jgi:hypothetical protein
MTTMMDLRKRWLRRLADKINAGRGPSYAKKFPFPRLNAVEIALIDVHVGLSHLFGADNDEAAIDPFCPASAVQDLVYLWRIGRQDIEVVGRVREVWTSLREAGTDLGLVHPELIASIDSSFLARRLDINPHSSLPPHPFWSIEPTEFATHTSVHDTWDSPGSHLGHLLASDACDEELLRGLTPLEKLALAGDEEDVTLRRDANLATESMHLYLAMPGGWGGPGSENVPPWIRDYALASGGRILQERAGVIPCWFVIAESVDELRAFSSMRHMRSVAIGMEPDFPGRAIAQIELDMGDGGDPGVVTFVYERHSREAAWSFDMLGWVEAVRVEVYSIEQRELKYAFSFGLHFNLRPAVSKIRNLADRSDTNSAPELDSSQTIITRMQNINRVHFELIQLGRRARNLGISAVEEPYDAWLTAIDVAARSEAAGVYCDYFDMEESRRQIVARASSLEITEPSFSLEWLPDGWGFLQLVLVTDEPMRIEGLLAYRDRAGTLRGAAIPLQEYSFSVGRLVTDDDGLDSLIELKLKGLILSPSGPLYAQATHEDFLQEGIPYVSYAHTSTAISVAPRENLSSEGLLLSAWAGDGSAGEPLSFLATEVRALEGLYGAARTDLPLSGTLPRVVHLAGHGMAGSRPTDHWLRASPSIDDLVTPARVLRQIDASATELVYLSACSTGRGVFTQRTIMEAVPLDVAFLERGARCVVSTAAPVNDAVASAFAIAFHSSWRAGASIWDAYVEARHLTSVHSASEAVLDVLEEKWPSWLQDLELASRSNPEDWRKFRISGRHW